MILAEEESPPWPQPVSKASSRKRRDPCGARSCSARRRVWGVVEQLPPRLDGTTWGSSTGATMTRNSRRPRITVGDIVAAIVNGIVVIVRCAVIAHRALRDAFWIIFLIAALAVGVLTLVPIP
jgi:hypothetical protein